MYVESEVILKRSLSDKGRSVLAPRLRFLSSPELLSAIPLKPKRLVLIVAGGGYHVVSEAEMQLAAEALLPTGCILVALMYRTAPTEFPYPQLDFLYALEELLHSSFPAVRSAARRKIDVYAMSAGAHLVLRALALNGIVVGPDLSSELLPMKPRLSLSLLYPIVNLGFGGGLHCQSALYSRGLAAGYVEKTADLVPKFLLPERITISQDFGDQTCDALATLALLQSLFSAGFQVAANLTPGAEHGAAYLRSMGFPVGMAVA